MSKRRKVGRHRTTPIRPLPFDVYAANKAVELSKLAWTGAGSISSNYPITVQRFKLRALVRKRKFVQLEDELGVPARPSVACSSVCYAWLSREKMCRMQAKETAEEKCENRIEIRFLIELMKILLIEIFVRDCYYKWIRNTFFPIYLIIRRYFFYSRKWYFE